MGRLSIILLLCCSAPLLLFLVPAAAAEPIPLVTITTVPLLTHLHPDGITTFATGASGPAIDRGGFGWTIAISANGNPGEVFASAELIDKYNTDLPLAGTMGISTDFGSEVDFDSDQFWSNGEMFEQRPFEPPILIGTSETHVPRLGRWLEGYTVTDVSLLATYDPPGFVGAANVRLRFFGEPVPEPQTWLLGSYAILFHLRTRRWADNIGAR